MPRGVDIELVFDRFLGEGDEIDRLQSLLARLAPKWWAGAHVYIGPGKREPIELAAEDGLRRAVLSAALARGPVYEAMVARYGAGEERQFGMAEVRGASPALTLVIDVDERPLARMRDGTLLLGNRLTVQIRRQRVEGTPVRAWADEALRALAGLAPPWGSACAADEYEAKVMGEFPGGSRGALGRDFARFLPGLFWLNLFGDPYVELIGRERLLSCPAAEVADLGPTVLVRLDDDPFAWEGDAYGCVEAKAKEHLGADLFFAKSAPDRSTRAPDWELSATNQL